MSKEPQLTGLGTGVIILFIAACAYGAFTLFSAKKPGAAPVAVAGSPAAPPKTEPGAGAVVEIGIAYGTEKKSWLTSAVEKFAATERGKKIKVNLLPMGSLEGAQAVLAGNPKINVWTPASSLYEDVFLQEWQLKNGKSPIARKEILALMGC